jgi:hypothetical protein
MTNHFQHIEYVLQKYRMHYHSIQLNVTEVTRTLLLKLLARFAALVEKRSSSWIVNSIPLILGIL